MACSHHQFYLPPLPQRKLPSASQPSASSSSRQAQLDRMERQKVEMDELDHQVERRREIYKNELFVKVRPSPSKSFPLFSPSPLTRVAHRVQPNHQVRAEPDSTSDHG